MPRASLTALGFALAAAILGAQAAAHAAPAADPGRDDGSGISLDLSRSYWRVRLVSEGSAAWAADTLYSQRLAPGAVLGESGGIRVLREPLSRGIKVDGSGRAQIVADGDAVEVSWEQGYQGQADQRSKQRVDAVELLDEHGRFVRRLAARDLRQSGRVQLSDELRARHPLLVPQEIRGPREASARFLASRILRGLPDDYLLPNPALDRALLGRLVARGIDDLPTAELRALEGKIEARERERIAASFSPSRASGTQSDLGSLVAELLRDLGPGYEKLGQFLGGRPDLVNPRYRQPLRRLTRGAPLPRSTVEAQIAAEGDDRVRRLGELMPAARGAGSIAVVHDATWDGEPVVVKVWKPGVAERLARDFDGMQDVLGRERNPALGRLVAGMRARTVAETQPRAEAAAIGRARREGVGDVALPAVRYAGDGILVMTRLTGQPPDAARLDDAGRAVAARRVFGAVAQQVVLGGLFHGDPHEGNVLLDDEGGRPGMIDWGLTGALDRGERGALGDLLEAIEARSVVRTRVALRTYTRGLGRHVVDRAVAKAFAANPGTLAAAQGVLLDLQLVGARLPDGLVAASKALLLAEGVATELDPGFGRGASLADWPAEELDRMLARALPDDLFVPGAPLDRRLLTAVLRAGIARLRPREQLALAQEMFDARQAGGAVADGRAVAELLRGLGPGFEKFGQFLGGRPDLIRPRYRTALRALSDQGRRVAPGVLRRVLDRELDAARDEVELAAEEPLGVGSIAETRVGRYRGAAAAIKVGKPGVAGRLERDFRTVLGVLEGDAQRDTRRLLDELRAYTVAETDQRREAASLTQGARDLRGTGVGAPRVLEATDNVLVMERVSGVSPIEAARRLAPAARRELARRTFNAVATLVLTGSQFHLDPHVGNFLIDVERPDRGGRPSVALIDWGQVATIDGRGRRQLAALFAAAVVGSDRGMVLALANGDRRFDRKALRRLVARHGGRLRGESLVAGTSRLLREYQRAGGQVAGDVLRASKALLQAEGVALELDPGFRAERAVAHLGRPLIGHGLARIGDAAKAMRGQLRSLAHRTRAGRSPQSVSAGAGVAPRRTAPRTGRSR